MKKEDILKSIDQKFDEILTAFGMVEEFIANNPSNDGDEAIRAASQGEMYVCLSVL
jgi:hypothetical protein